MSTIAVDGLSEEDFRRSIENRLRDGQSGLAVERLRKLLDPYCGPGRILPERFMTVQSKDLLLTGWQVLEPAIQRHDRPGKPVTALSIAFGWPGDDVPQPDDLGNLRPHIETGYFSDDAFPFSQSAREDLLDGYSFHGCTWASDCIAVDNALSLEGVDDLCGALALLEARLLSSDEPDEDEIRAGSLAACLLSALLVQAVGERIERDGMPRPLCIMAGSNGVYPYFDAPVAGFPEDARKANEAEEEVLDLSIPGPRYSSLLMTGVPRGRKRAVLVLEETETETASRIANLRGLQHMQSEAAPPPPPEPLFPAAAPASPLMTKKPGDKSWDFRDLLGPRDNEPPEPPATGADDWDDWGEPEEPKDTGPAIEQEEAALEEPVFDAVEPEDWGDTQPLEAAADDVAEFEAPAELENWAREAGAVEWPDSPELVEPESHFPPIFPPEEIVPVELPLEPEAFEPEVFEALAEPDPDPVEAREPLDWPEPEIEPEPEAPFEPPLAETPPGHADFAPLDWADPLPEPRVSVGFGARLPKPGFDLLGPADEEPRPLPAIELVPEEPEWVEPAAVAIEPVHADIPNWPLGLGWLEAAEPDDVEEPAPPPERPGLWARLKAWLGR